MLILSHVLSIVDIIVIHMFLLVMIIILEQSLLLMIDNLLLIFKNFIKKMEKPKTLELMESIKL